jgi:hypothetical protein
VLIGRQHVYLALSVHRSNDNFASGLRQPKGRVQAITLLCAPSAKSASLWCSWTRHTPVTATLSSPSGHCLVGQAGTHAVVRAQGIGIIALATSLRLAATTQQACTCGDARLGLPLQVVDMESAGFMHACKSAGVPCLVIRSASDLAGGDEGLNVVLTFLGIAATHSVWVLRKILSVL